MNHAESTSQHGLLWKASHCGKKTSPTLADESENKLAMMFYSRRSNCFPAKPSQSEKKGRQLFGVLVVTRDQRGAREGRKLVPTV